MPIIFFFSSGYILLGGLVILFDSRKPSLELAKGV